MKRWMKFWLFTVTAASLLVAAPATAASPMPEIARKAGCLACHGIDGKIIGPAFTWVADKYKENRETGKKVIVDRIANGSKGQWIRQTGMIIMPPYASQTTEAQRNELADFILSLDPVAPPE